MQKLKFQKGDWCFCEFKLQLVKNTEENRITEVSDGFFSLGSLDLSDRCFPLSLKTKCASDIVSNWHDKFHAVNNIGLNYPDLNRALISMWVELCENIDNDSEVQRIYDKINAFGNSVLKKCRNLQGEYVDGVQLFRS